MPQRFEPLVTGWWHYNAPDASKYEVLNEKL